MPLYEFRCLACKTLFERLEDSPPYGSRKCPVCGGEAKRTYSPPTPVYRGDGFSKRVENKSTDVDEKPT